MSDSDRTTSLAGNKRAASPTNAVAEVPAQRLRLSEAAAADPPAAALSPLSAAQRCAADTLTLVFGFIELKHVIGAARTCKAWLAAAVKEKPRGLSRWIDQADRLADLCASSSSFKKHISRVHCSPQYFSIKMLRLVQLSQLPELTALDVRVRRASLIRLMNHRSGVALAKLQAFFPPKLQELTLHMSKVHSQAWQLLLDALPAMKGLQDLTLKPAHCTDDEPGHHQALSLEPLLQLPRLTHLTLDMDELTVSQLLTIKQIATLQSIDTGTGSWSVAQLSALCRPPHQLQQLQEINLWETTVDAAAMGELVCLPALTAIEPLNLTPGAYAFLPRFLRLQRLLVPLHRYHVHPVHQAEHNALLASALSACPALTDLRLSDDDCFKSFGSQLMQAVPRLRSLAFDDCSLPSLAFLRHAPNLTDLTLTRCTHMRPGHVVSIGSFAPQLECLTVEEDGDRSLLDKEEQRMLTPPGAIRLPHLREFTYIPAEPEGS